jgi:predicted peroxiredoxin
MKKLMLFISVVALLASCTQMQAPKTETTQEQITGTEAIRDGIFIHITESYNDPHRVLMPMKMATLMADDKDVIVYLDIHAVELLVKDAADLTFDGFDSFQTYLQRLSEMNVGVYACPTCLKIAGHTPEDLMPGVQIANKEKFFNFTKGRILTLDY